MKAICNALKNCVLRCFRSEEDEYKQRMIQLQQRMLNRDSSKIQAYETDFYSRISGPSILPQQQSPKKVTQQTETPTQEHPRQASGNRHSNNSVDSYFTIHSGSASSYSISRRSFKSIQRRKSLISQQILSKIGNDTKLSEFKDMNNQNTSQTDLKLSRVQSQYNSLSQAMFEWNQCEYQRQDNGNLRVQQINQSQILKLQNNIFINEAVNRMQDYYTFYFNQINKQFTKSQKKQQIESTKTSGHYLKKYPQFKCSYSWQHENMHSPQTYMFLLTFQSNTSNPLEFLKWYNSSQVQQKLFNIQKQKIIQNGTYPIFNVQQFSSEIREKYLYLTVRQIEAVKFDSDPDSQYILQLDTTFRKGNWMRRLIRFSDSDFDNGLVEIYCEGMEKLRALPEEYFFRKCKILEGLLHDRLVKISMSRVVK